MTWTAIFVEIRFARGDFSEFGKSQFVWTTEVTLLAQHSNPVFSTKCIDIYTDPAQNITHLLPSFEGEYKYEGILNFISRVFISGIFILFAYWRMAGVIVWIEMIKSLRYYIKSLRLYNICIKKCHTDEIQNIIIKTFGIERTVKGDFESPFPRLSACSRINELLSYEGITYRAYV